MRATQALLKRSVWKGMHSLLPSMQPQLTQSQARTLSRKLPDLLLHLLTFRLPIVFPKKQGDKVPPVRTQSRSATILPNFVGLKFEIHNGKDYHLVTITEDMVGHKLGEFAP